MTPGRRRPTGSAPLAGSPLAYGAALMTILALAPR
jgi:hypothetical protein